MADADVLPYDYEEYGKEIAVYLDAAQKRSKDKFGAEATELRCGEFRSEALPDRGSQVLAKEKNPPRDATRAESGADCGGTRAAFRKDCRTVRGSDMRSTLRENTRDMPPS